MKKSLFALAFIACFAFGATELETLEKECNDGNMESCLRAALQYEDDTKTLLSCLKKPATADMNSAALQCRA